MAIRFTGIRRVTHDEDRRLEAEFWASRTIAERVIAGWALAENDLCLQANDEPEKRTNWVLRRVARGRQRIDLADREELDLLPGNIDLKLPE